MVKLCFVRNSIITCTTRINYRIYIISHALLQLGKLLITTGGELKAIPVYSIERSL